MIESPFNDACDPLYERGYSIIPIAPKTKFPGSYKHWTGQWVAMPNWDKFTDSQVSRIMLDQWKQWPKSGIGITLGQASKIIALDFDTDDKNVQEQIESIAGKSPVKKAGKKGFTSFYKYNSEISYKWAIDGIMILELLSNGRQTVLPPTLHPDTGKPYTWLESDLKDINPDDLPSLPKDFKQQIDSLLKPKKDIQDYYPPHTLAAPEIEDVREALNHIPSSDYQSWIDIGMALQSQFGDQGLSLWNEWSSKDPSKYKGIQDCLQHWKSFNNTGGITIATLFWIAQQNGYQRRFNGHTEPYQEIYIPEIIDPIEAKIIKAKAKLDQLEYTKEHLNPPGLVGRINKWINDSSIIDQPIMSLAASIAATGLIFGHKITSPTDLRTNIYVISLAPTGTGKDHPRKCIESLFNHAGIDNFLGGRPASGPGLISSLLSSQGKKLLQIDEFGRYLGGINSNKSATYQSQIIDYMIEMYSTANSVYRGAEYANHDGKMLRKDINQPHLCVNGSTVPSRFWEALTSKEMADGFLQRFFIFESENPNPKRKLPTASRHSPPQDLIDEIIGINRMKSNHAPTSDIDAVLSIRPLPVNFTPQATYLLEQFYDWASEKRITAFYNNDPLEGLWARAYENAIKLSLLTYEQEDIKEQGVEWAISLTKLSIERSLVRVRDNISDNAQEGLFKKVHSIIKVFDQGISLTDLTRRTQFLRTKERFDLLQDLVMSGLVVKVEVPQSSNRGRPITKYVAVQE